MLISSLAYPLILAVKKITNSELATTITLLGISASIGFTGVQVTYHEYLAQKNQWLNILTQTLVGGSFYILGYSIRKVVWRSLNLYVAIAAFLGFVRKVVVAKIAAMTGWRPVWQGVTNFLMRHGS